MVDATFDLLELCVKRGIEKVIAASSASVYGMAEEFPTTERQNPFDLVWIREPFLSFDGDLPQVVVHGHTPAEVPVVRPHRIGVDTGACFGGTLSCVVLEGQRLRFLSA